MAFRRQMNQMEQEVSSWMPSSDRTAPPSTSVKGHTKQSKKMPYWLWFIIAKSLGIRLHPQDKPMLSVGLHVVTLLSAGGMLFTRMWFCGYDISSAHTQTDILDGIVAILMVFLYVSMGVYAHRLAYRLFIHPKFLELMRLHSKTIVKLNAAVLVVLVMTTFVIINNLETLDFLQGDVPNDNMKDGFSAKDKSNSSDETPVNPCQTVQIPLVICQAYYVSQVVFSFFFLLWNAMVAAVLVSVARTHTIAIRRFICQLDYDAFLHDENFRKSLYTHNSPESKDTLQHYVWTDTDDLSKVLGQSDPDVHELVHDEVPIQATSLSGRRISREEDNIEVMQSSDDGILNEQGIHLEFTDENVIDQQAAAAQPEPEQRRGSSSSSNNVSNRTKLKNPLRSKMFGRFRRLSQGTSDNTAEDIDDSIEPHIMSEQELLHKYWKLATSTRLTSQALQRWMCCVTVTVLFWSAVRIVYWLSHTPTLYEVLTFVLPLLILPLLASAYAEVNYQGIIVLQSIMPTAQRTGLFRYLYGMPIQLNVYGRPVNYGTMGTVFAAILAAFASRIFIQEMNKIIN